MNLGIFLEKEKKEEERTTWRILRERETMLLDEKQLGGGGGKCEKLERETIEGGKSTRQDQMSMETRLIMIYGEEMLASMGPPCPAIRKIWFAVEKIWTWPIGQKFFEIAPPAPLFLIVSLDMIITKIATPLQSSNWSRQRLSFLNSYNTR